MCHALFTAQVIVVMSRESLVPSGGLKFGATRDQSLAIVMEPPSSTNPVGTLVATLMEGIVHTVLRILLVPGSEALRMEPKELVS
jgi:hypothetical protein